VVRNITHSQTLRIFLDFICIMKCNVNLEKCFLFRKILNIYLFISLFYNLLTRVSMWLKCVKFCLVIGGTQITCWHVSTNYEKSSRFRITLLFIGLITDWNLFSFKLVYKIKRHKIYIYIYERSSQVEVAWVQEVWISSACVWRC
jgi:hypothetical protein